MIIAGLQKTTLIDYPGKIACVVFLAGCNFRCPWCYSAELVLPEKILKQHRISEAEIFDFLRKRKGLLEGVVICGGEPTINKDLPQFIEKIKKFNYPVKLDTNGSNPKMLKDLVSAKLIDYVAMDIKAPWALKFEARNSKSEIYEQIMQEGVKMADIEESVEFLKSEIAKWIGGPEVKYNLQNFRAEKTIDPEFEKIKPYPDAWLKEVVSEISPHFKECRNR
ncbi:MAG: anaerobic ribonucleoside-triphosphate reductase activating protein [Candidatus Staskawiczbacteria bacterium RIFOXYC1_FULL_37_52]|nr:MAG: anaerobic ribonucleoside-triphosphate reductase activating protein [Candidatus Staskawiczbacteria bacterium RIFOXYC1_FULL_37_52]